MKATIYYKGFTVEIEGHPYEVADTIKRLTEEPAFRPENPFPYAPHISVPILYPYSYNVYDGGNENEL